MTKSNSTVKELIKTSESLKKDASELIASGVSLVTDLFEDYKYLFSAQVLEAASKPRSKYLEPERNQLISKGADGATDTYLRVLDKCVHIGCIATDSNIIKAVETIAKTLNEYAAKEYLINFVYPLGHIELAPDYNFQDTLLGKKSYIIVSYPILTKEGANFFNSSGSDLIIPTYGLPKANFRD